MENDVIVPLRSTSQRLLPPRPEPRPDGYDIYPSHPLESGQIQLGHAALAKRIVDQNVVAVDGFGGVQWDTFRSLFDAALLESGRTARWVPVADALLDSDRVEALVEPFMGGSDAIFGTAFTGNLADFFDPDALAGLNPVAGDDLTILYGCGAALAGWNAFLIYLDVPKNEIQFRARAGNFVNLGMQEPLAAKPAYKRCYFVDWPALSAHKRALLPQIDVIVDEQRPDEPAFADGAVVRSGLAELASTVFRVRPWFEPGPWGGQWIKERVPQLPRDVPNYAWSFELIVPENGLLFESDGTVLETSFDMLMFTNASAVLGESAARFGTEFPIRLDFLDTFEGGNLSVQVHPRPEYIREHFGERFTQDETYYILDAAPEAVVYLGFQDDIEPEVFRAELERSERDATPVDIERFVQTHPSSPGDFFLIPHGTVHSSGIGNLVLEISATPYIFTFKLYDWLRMDLDGRPRPINLARGFENAYFDRKGTRVAEEFISRPRVLADGDGWSQTHLPTHSDHFYDVHRWQVDGGAAVEVPTHGSCQVMSLVAGSAVVVESNGVRRRFAFAESFVVPASAQKFTLMAEDGDATVVAAFVKPGRGPV